MSALSVENSVSPLNSTSLNQATGLEQGSDLNQADFIELLVAQVKNQDPSKPLDPSQFMNQLAQFSTVNGVQELKTSFDSLAGNLTSDQSLRAASLVGRSVMIPGGDGLLQPGKNVEGHIELSESTPQVTLKVFSSTGELVRTLPMGAQADGQIRFNWDGLDDGGVRASTGKYRIEAEALVDGSAEAMPVSVETHVDSISVNQELAGSPAATVLNLATGESVHLSAVQQIR